MSARGLALVWLALAAAACGPADGFGGHASAALILRQELADDLSGVTIYVFETERGVPRCEELLGNTESYQSYKETRKASFYFQDQNNPDKEVVIDGIPDHGPVWRFYARGYDGANLLIAHGCNVSLFPIPADSDQPIDVSISLDWVTPPNP